MSRRALRAFGRIAAPSLLLLLIAIAGLSVGSYWQYVLALSISAALIGSALAMLVGYARCITMATGAMLAIGAYAAAVPVVRLGAPFLPALAFAALAGAVAGIILAVPGVRFRSHNLAMVTFVFQAVVIIVLRESKLITGGAEGLHVPSPVVFGIPFRSDAEFLLLCGALAGVMVLPLAVLLAGPFGSNLRALATNESAARAFGIDVRRYLIAAFTWSSAAIAFAGGLSAPRFRVIDPDSYGILASISALAYPIIGGMGSIWGGLVGGAVLRVMPEVLRPLADYIELIFCILVVATLTFCPEGIAAAARGRLRRRPAVWSGRGPTERPAQPPHDLVPATVVAKPGWEPGHDRAPLLRVEGAAKSYGAVRAVNDVSIEVPRHALHGLMGPNGAGKTTLFNLLSGFIAPDAGRLILDGKDLARVPIEHRIGLGMTRTFQHAAVFRQLSCLDNVIIGLGRNGVWRASLRSAAAAVDALSACEERRAALAALDAVGLGPRARDAAGALSLGDQRRLELARAIVSRPRLLLLDEPVSGVAVEEASRLHELLAAINREFGMAMIVIEHNIGFLVSLCERISVMSEGRVIAEGEPRTVIGDPRVRRVYFGDREAAA